MHHLSKFTCVVITLEFMRWCQIPLLFPWLLLTFVVPSIPLFRFFRFLDRSWILFNFKHLITFLFKVLFHDFGSQSLDVSIIIFNQSFSVSWDITIVGRIAVILIIIGLCFVTTSSG